MRIAVVFDNEQRPETTGFYCRRALSGLADVEHLLPHELPLVTAGLFDLYVLVDDGLDYDIPDSLRPRVAWAIDTHMDLNRAVQRFGDSDYLFAAQKNGAAALADRTGRAVEWLPLACDPEIHCPVTGTKKVFDIGFVGHLIGERRRTLIDQLSRRFPNSLFCQAVFDDMSLAYSQSRVGFNCSVADDLNMRLFEVPAHGIPLVTNQIENNGLEELFTIGQNLLTYQTDEELPELIEGLLSRPNRCRSLGEAGRNHVLEHHTYAHRMQRLLQVADRNSRVAVSIPKALDYFEFPRPDVQELIPAEAKRILDVGCGAGALGAAVKRTRSVHVTGIEPDAAAASRAVERLDHVHRKSAEDLSDRDFAGQKFDCIVFADVLEHLRNPTRVLKRCRNWLSDSGSVVISVPNSRHLSVVSGLVDGNWTYERAGLLDEDHVRCFTRRELEKLLFRCGYAVDEMKLAPGDGYSAWQQAGRPGEIHAGRFHIGGLTPVEAEEFYAYQYLVRAVPQAPPDFGLTSIVIVTWNQLQYTRQCVDSLLSRTDEPVELIFVDNGSADGTPEYLATIENATVIRNSENRGYAPAVNQGLQVCRGDQIVLLNNDCVVSTGWLHQLLSALHDDPRNGLVGPISNSVSGPQQVPVTYTDMASMDGFAWDCRHDRRLQETDRLVGFCLLFRREVLERIGDLDERFEVGCFEDDDFCRRASGAGYRVLIAPNAFVHHYGSATFRGAGLDFAEIMRANEQRYAEKWSDSTEREISAGEITSDLPAVEYVAHELDNGERLLQRKHVVVSCV